MYVCAYVCMYVCMNVCTYVCTYIMYVCMFIIIIIIIMYTTPSRVNICDYICGYIFLCIRIAPRSSKHVKLPRCIWASVALLAHFSSAQDSKSSNSACLFLLIKFPKISLQLVFFFCSYQLCSQMTTQKAYIIISL